MAQTDHSQLTKSRLIHVAPAIVQTISPAANAWLAGMPVPDFSNVADAKALWAAPANDANEGSVYVGGGGGTEQAYVVSAEVYKRLKTRRF